MKKILAAVAATTVLTLAPAAPAHAQPFGGPTGTRIPAPCTVLVTAVRHRVHGHWVVTLTKTTCPPATTATQHSNIDWD